jgi:hypothetical protein
MLQKIGIETNFNIKLRCTGEVASYIYINNTI